MSHCMATKHPTILFASNLSFGFFFSTSIKFLSYVVAGPSSEFTESDAIPLVPIDFRHKYLYILPIFPGSFSRTAWTFPIHQDSLVFQELNIEGSKSETVMDGNFVVKYSASASNGG